MGKIYSFCIHYRRRSASEKIRNKQQCTLFSVFSTLFNFKIWIIHDIYSWIASQDNHIRNIRGIKHKRIGAELGYFFLILQIQFRKIFLNNARKYKASTDFFLLFFFFFQCNFCFILPWYISVFGSILNNIIMGS